jgi:FHA domain
LLLHAPLESLKDDTHKPKTPRTIMSEEEDKTRIVRPLDQLQRPINPEPSDVDPTRKIDREYNPDTRTTRPSREADEGKTVLFRPSPNRPVEGTTFSPRAPRAEAQEPSNDPVVGWLIVVKGPGRGNAVRLGYGWNSIGRDASQRACLNFGDSQISRLSHAKLLYEPRSRKFSLTLGEGTNPTYLRGDVLLAPTEIKSGDRIQMGETELLFLALCGENFEWHDNA